MAGLKVVLKQSPLTQKSFFVCFFWASDTEAQDDVGWKDAAAGTAVHRRRRRASLQPELRRAVHPQEESRPLLSDDAVRRWGKNTVLQTILKKQRPTDVRLHSSR